MLKHNKAFLGDKNYHGEQQPILTPKIKLEHFFVPNISMFLEFKINGESEFSLNTMRTI